MAKSLYLPISKAAKEGFQRYEAKQKAREPALLASWGEARFPLAKCLDFVPECEFFQEAGLPLLLRKCCAEHTKLRESFEYTMDAADALGVPLFLDSGTLLSAERDGGHTLVPWETDIDLGIVGVEPDLVATPFAKFAKTVAKSKGGEEGRWWHRKHLFDKCLTKVSKNASRHGRLRWRSARTQKSAARRARPVQKQNRLAPVQASPRSRR